MCRHIFFLCFVIIKLKFIYCAKVPWENENDMLRTFLKNINSYATSTFYFLTIAVIIYGIIYLTGLTGKLKNHFNYKFSKTEDVQTYNNGEMEILEDYDNIDDNTLPITFTFDVLPTDKKKSKLSCNKVYSTPINSEKNYTNQEMNEYKENMKKLFEERIRARKILISNFNMCIQLNKNHPLIPWAKKYTLNQLNQQKIALIKESKILESNANKCLYKEDIDMSHSGNEKEEKLLTGKHKNSSEMSFAHLAEEAIPAVSAVSELCRNIFKT